MCVTRRRPMVVTRTRSERTEAMTSTYAAQQIGRIVRPGNGHWDAFHISAGTTPDEKSSST